MIGDGRLRGRSLPAAACAVRAALLSHPLVPAGSLLPQWFPEGRGAAAAPGRSPGQGSGSPGQGSGSRGRAASPPVPLCDWQRPCPASAAAAASASPGSRPAEGAGSG